MDNCSSTSRKNRPAAPHLPPEAFSEIEHPYYWKHVLDPLEMVKIVERYRQLEELVASDAGNETAELINWRECLDSDYWDIEESYKSYSLETPLPSNPEVDIWIDFIEKQFLNATGNALTQKDWQCLLPKHGDELFEFQVNPTEAVAEKHPWLKKIPGITEKAKAVELARQWLFAEFVLEILPRPLCLVRRDLKPQEFSYPIDLTDLLKGTLECWMFLGAAFSGIAHSCLQDMSLLKYSAVFVDAKDNGDTSLIAMATGFYVVPFKGEHEMSLDSFKAAMCAHSAMLTDVWKVVMGKFLPRHQWSSLDDFYDDNYGTSGIATGAITVNPNFRGRKLSHYLLITIRSMTEESYYCDYLAPDWVFDEDEDPDDHDIEPDSLSFAPIGLFVLAIEGTMPLSRNLINAFGAANAFDLSPLPKARVIHVDIATERKRLNLVKYFNDLEVLSEGNIYIQTYNPFDYPGT